MDETTHEPLRPKSRGDLYWYLGLLAFFGLWTGYAVCLGSEPGYSRGPRVEAIQEALLAGGVLAGLALVILLALAGQSANKRVISLGVVWFAALFIGAIVGSNFRRPGGGANEVAAIGALKTIGDAQSLFRESDKEGDKNLDYGTLRELGAHGLIDQVLASGTKQGFLFEVTYGVRSSEFLWYATARPVLPNVTAGRSFVRNHEGLTFWTLCENPLVLNSVDCTIPAGLTPVGR